MAKPTYYDLLRDPRWQRKRLEIMERADFTCEDCGDDSTTLNVHHGYYEKGLAPWEYPNESLHCLCEPCHERAQELLTRLHRQIGILGGAQLHTLLGMAHGIDASDCPVGGHEIAGLEELEGLIVGFTSWVGDDLRVTKRRADIVLQKHGLGLKELSGFEIFEAIDPEGYAAFVRRCAAT
jgi:hypothetical protein